MSQAEMQAAIWVIGIITGLWTIYTIYDFWRKRQVSKSVDVVSSAMDLLKEYKERAKELDEDYKKKLREADLLHSKHIKEFIDKLSVAENTIDSMSKQLDTQAKQIAANNEEIATVNTKLVDAHTEINFLRMQVKIMSQQIKDTNEGP